MSALPVNVVVGSANPGKVEAVRGVVAALWPDAAVRGAAVPSGVPDQPLGVAQTRRGAVNRARAARRTPGATWGVGLEGGVRFDRDGAWLFGVVAVSAADGPVLTARTAELRLPASVAARVRAGEELGPVMDGLLGTADLKRGVGTVGAVTGGLVTRPQVWAQALALALAPLIAPDVYAVG